ncbi:MAG: GNAT family N-acetyltransferase [Phycisphaerales bacterium]|nr:GNAT family N-acetyltransferase [Phycisphaerales bacterium]
MSDTNTNSLAQNASGSGALAIAPVPRCSIAVRVAVSGDVPFIDSLQKMHSHMVGWSPTKQLEVNIEGGHILIAEDQVKTPVGYCIARDQYMKRDDVGIVYQLNVLPLRQRHLVGASLIKACFERAAYGCKLFSCWCAQDIQANYFWESIGFIPLAFRTGSRAKQRIHIFWQRRVRDNDASTPYWFPSQTQNGAVKEDRIVLPIPLGTHWRDAKPLILPGLPDAPKDPGMAKTLPGGALVRPRPEQPKVSQSQRVAIVRSQSKHLKGLPPGKAAVVTAGGIRYIERGDYVPEAEPPKPKREPKPRQKNDPKYVAAARELRDRFLEQINTDRMLPSAHGKYDVSRALEAAPTELKQTPLLKAA